MERFFDAASDGLMAVWTSLDASDLERALDARDGDDRTVLHVSAVPPPLLPVRMSVRIVADREVPSLTLRWRTNASRWPHPRGRLRSWSSCSPEAAPGSSTPATKKGGPHSILRPPLGTYASCSSLCKRVQTSMPPTRPDAPLCTTLRLRWGCTLSVPCTNRRPGRFTKAIPYPHAGARERLTLPVGQRREACSPGQTAGYGLAPGGRNRQSPRDRVPA
eukprot:scaffold705_cov402-Prasinococcus_capsulatus_cf.AAC.33